MKKKKNAIKVIIILFISLIVAVAFFFGLKTYQGHKNIQLIDSYLEEKNLKDKIKSEKTEYSAKKGLFYKDYLLKALIQRLRKVWKLQSINISIRIINHQNSETYNWWNSLVPAILII